jgi:hypothetical protein
MQDIANPSLCPLSFVIDMNDNYHEFGPESFAETPKKDFLLISFLAH